MIYFNDIVKHEADAYTELLFDKCVVGSERGDLSVKCLQHTFDAFEEFEEKLTTAMVFHATLFLPTHLNDDFEKVTKEFYYRLRRQVVASAGQASLGPRNTCLIGAKTIGEKSHLKNAQLLNVSLLINPRLLLKRTKGESWSQVTSKGIKRLKGMVASSWSFSIGQSKPNYEFVRFASRNVDFLNQGSPHYKEVRAKVLYQLSMYTHQPKTTDIGKFFCFDGIWADAKKKRAA